LEVRGEQPFLDAEISGFLEPRTMNLEQERLFSAACQSSNLLVGDDDRGSVTRPVSVFGARLCHEMNDVSEQRHGLRHRLTRNEHTDAA